MKPIFTSPAQDKDQYTDVDTLVLDVSYIAHRHANALGKRFVTSEGEMSGHIFGAFKNIKSLVHYLSPRRLAFCYDRGYSWRSELVPSYKSTRRPSDGDDKAWSPGPEVERLFRTFPGMHLACDDLEADDMVAWLALNHDRNGAMVIYSADRDLWQLVSDGDEVACMYPRKGGGGRSKSKNVWVREGAVKADFGVSPGALAKLKALMGDPSDNIKGLIGGRRPGKKDALRAFSSTDACDMYLDTTVPTIDFGDTPEFVRLALEEERERLSANYKVTNLRSAATRVPAEPVMTSGGNVGDALGIMAEFECDSLMGQVVPFFETLS